MDFLFFGAQDETRTHTVLRPLPPQSSVYTNFTTCAFRNALSHERRLTASLATAIPSLKSN